MQLLNNQMVEIFYEVKDLSTNELLDSNVGKTPLSFILGHNQVVQALEEAVLKAKVGDKIDFIAEPAKAYGERDASLLQEVPRGNFEDIELERGMSLFGQSEDGQTVQVIVQDFNDQDVIIDYNHPLAGKTLAFNVEILSSRDASEQELHGGGCCSSGDASGGGGCGCSGGGHGSGGGCCGH